MNEKKVVEKREDAKKDEYRKPTLIELGSVKALTGSEPAAPPPW